MPKRLNPGLGFGNGLTKHLIPENNFVMINPCLGAQCVRRICVVYVGKLPVPCYTKPLKANTLVDSIRGHLENSFGRRAKNCWEAKMLLVYTLNFKKKYNVKYKY